MSDELRQHAWLDSITMGTRIEPEMKEGARVQVRLPDGQLVWGTVREKANGRLYLEPDHEIVLGPFVECDGTVYKATT